MANEVRNYFYAAQSLDVTNLHSLASGDIWHSEVINDAPSAYTQYPYFYLAYSLDWTGAGAGDSAEFYVLREDELAAGSKWEGGVTASQGTLTTDANVAAVRDNCVPVARLTLGATINQTEQNGVIEVVSPFPRFKVAVYVVGAPLAASGSNLSYRFAEPKGI